MREAERQSARIAISACSLKRRFKLEEALERGGWYVVINAPLKAGMLSRVTESRPDALVVDIEGASDQDLEITRFLLRSSAVSVLVSDAEVEHETGDEQQWIKRLNEKLEAMISGGLLRNDRAEMSVPVDGNRSAGADDVSGVDTPVPVPEALPAREPNVVTLLKPAKSWREEAVERDQDIDHQDVVEHVDFSTAVAAGDDNHEGEAAAWGRQNRDSTVRVWVLGASLGGPQAVARFLSGIPADMEITFILVQRIDPAFIPMLVKQLSNRCAFSVVPAADGHVLRHGEVIVVSADQRITLDSDGVLALSDVAADAQSGGLDHAMREVAGYYQTNAGAIIFSGMGGSGIYGGHAIIESGGTVWTQNADSCVISSMPNHVRDACKVKVSADPEALTNHLIEKLAADNFVRVGNAVG